MDNAGRVVAESARDAIKRTSGRRVAVFCGSGHNGGDGVAAARYLRNWGYRVQVLWMKNPRLWEGDVAQHYHMAKAMGVVFKSYHGMTASKHKADLIIDALLGTGTRGEIHGPYRDAIETINRSRRPVIAVDIPSGLDADTGKPLGVAVKATLTVTMAAPKQGMLKPSSRPYVGKLLIADIGIPKRLL
jgi:NAD(P)H-hydrate epimerase